jgi:hypothetical protein
MNSEKETNSKSLGFLMATVFAIILHFWSSNMKEKGLETLTWPSTKGTVLTSEIITHTSKDKDGQLQTSYSANIIVEYVVSGIRYQTGQIDTSGMSVSSSSPSSAQKIVSKYGKFSTVDVFYNDKIHGQAVLVPGVPPIAKYLGYASIALFILAASLFAKLLVKILIIVVGTREIFKFFRKKKDNPENINNLKGNNKDKVTLEDSKTISASDRNDGFTI